MLQVFGNSKQEGGPLAIPIAAANVGTYLCSVAGMFSVEISAVFVILCSFAMSFDELICVIGKA